MIVPETFCLGICFVLFWFFFFFLGGGGAECYFLVGRGWLSCFLFIISCCCSYRNLKNVTQKSSPTKYVLFQLASSGLLLIPFLLRWDGNSLSGIKDNHKDNPTVLVIRDGSSVDNTYDVDYILCFHAFIFFFPCEG